MEACFSTLCTYWCQGKPTLRGGLGGCCGKSLDENVLKDIEQENERQKQEMQPDTVKDAQPSSTAEMKETNISDDQLPPEGKGRIESP